MNQLHLVEVVVHQQKVGDSLLKELDRIKDNLLRGIFNGIITDCFIKNFSLFQDKKNKYFLTKKCYVLHSEHNLENIILKKNLRLCTNLFPETESFSTFVIDIF